MPDTIVNPHDKFFKESFSQLAVAQDFLRQYLPADVAGLLDLTSLTLHKDSFVDQELQERFADLLYQVTLRSGDEAYVYVLFEHKSYPEPLVALQVLRYMVKIWDYTQRQTGRLSPIFPVVLYHGTAAWHSRPNFHAMLSVPAPLQPYVPEFRYWLCDLSRYTDTELQGAALFQVTVLMLKYIFRDELTERLPDIARLLRTLYTDQPGMAYVEAVLRYLVSAAGGRLDEQVIQAAITETFDAGGQIMGTLAQQWLERGKQEGWQKGKQEGKQEGLQEGKQEGLQEGLQQYGLVTKAREDVFTVLGLRFGALPLEVVQPLNRLDDITRLTALLKAAVTTPTLPEFAALLTGDTPH